ncbi:MAG: dipeptide epimerase [Herpetosiphonaceae bacterium]|nr:dipeptide epimerase [Herpetosiphonaceae bacterium]
MHIAAYPLELHLRTTFRIAHGASDTRQTVLLQLGAGWGEAAPVSYHGESVDQVLAFIERQRPILEQIADPAAIRAVLSRLETGSRAARAAVDLALHDALGKRLGVNVRTLLGLDGLPIPPTSFTLAIAEPEILREQATAAAHYPILKIKLGGPADLASVALIRAAAPNSRLRVDANAGWSLAQAEQLIPALIEHNVELIEQPLAVDDLAGYAALHAHGYPVPIFADEPIRSAADVAHWAPVVDGVNIKLMKTGGIVGALEAIATARAHGLQVMLGCMIETSLGVSAAAALAGLADYVDLDGPLLICNDPTSGLRYAGAQIVPPVGPGLGVTFQAPA